jgi:hypothetical protein
MWNMTETSVSPLHFSKQKIKIGEASDTRRRYAQFKKYFLSFF